MFSSFVPINKFALYGANFDVSSTLSVTVAIISSMLTSVPASTMYSFLFLPALPASGRVIVAGVNLVKKAMKKRTQQDRGGIAEVEASLHISNVAIVCKKCGPTRIGYKLDGDKKLRVCRKCGDTL